jgi:ubiquitin carboxyl-terminal hydrolase 25/28
VIHDGNAQEGHYYTYIKDHQRQIWQKFNDSKVSQVQEAEVMEHSVGGLKKKTAFWLVYISEEKCCEAQKFVVSH